MSTGPPILLPILGTLAGSWLCLSIFVVVSRTLHDLRRRAVETAAGTAPGRAPRGSSLLTRHGPSAAALLAADAAAPATPEVRRAAELEAAENRTRLLSTASAHHGELGRWRRIAALRILARAGDPEALPLLERALAEGDAQLAGAAVDIVGSVGDRAATELLVRTLRDGTTSRSRVASQLDKHATRVGDLLVPLLDDPAPNVRFWAATLLSGYAGEPAVSAALAARATDTDANVRAAVAESLAAAWSSEARDRAVHTLLSDPVWYVRVHAARSAGDLGLASEAPALASLLADEEWWVRSAAKDGLAALGDAAIPVVVAVLDHRDRFARNGAAEILQNTGYVDALVSTVLDAPATPDDHDVELLRRIVDAGGSELRQSTLARTGSPAARERLEQLLGDVGVLAEAA